MSNQEGLIQLVPQQDNIIEVNQNLPEEEKPIYLFHEHFNCSEHDHDPISNNEGPPLDLWEADTYRYEFNLGMFFKSLIVFLFDISGLHLLIHIYPCISDSKFFYNIYDLDTPNLIMLFIGWINTGLLIYSICQKNFMFTDAECLLYFTGLLFYAVMGAAANSYINSKIPPLLNSVYFSEDSRDNTGLSGDVADDDLREFKRTTLRLKIDASSFFMTFLENTESIQFKREPIPPNNQTNINSDNQANEMKEERDKLILKRGISKENFVIEALKFEEAVFDYKFLTKPTRYDENKAYGYRYAEKIMGAYEGREYSMKFLAASATLAIVAVSFMKLDGSDDSLEGFVKRYLIKGCVLLANLSITFGILVVVMEGVDVLWTRHDFMKGMAELISEEKSSGESLFRKNCSMINIFDAESLRTWASLRMIFMNMEARNLEAASLGTSLVVSIQLVGLSILGFFYFTAEGSEQKDFFLQYIIFFGTLAIIFMTFVLLFIYFGSQVNNQYQEHIYLLKKLKMTIFKLFAMYPNLNGEGSVQPSTYLYARGVRYLEQSFGNQEITQQLLDEELKKINEAYEEVIEELETEEQYCPLKILGIPMTDSFVNTVLGSILTVIMIPASKYLADLTGWG